MPSNRTSNDIDLVEPTQYNIPPNRTAKKPPPKPWPLPDFQPLQIHNWDDHGAPNLPPNINRHDPMQLFNLFFTYEIINKLIK